MAFLTPQDRSLLLETLRPPQDYQLDVALGTTYSLDLVAMMVAPVGFTLFDVDPNDPAFMQRDPLEIIEAVRRHAEQIVLFHEAGRIAVPRHFRPLLTYLEGRTIAVTAPRKHRAFHPKVWVIRYLKPKGDVLYRLICSSRNLTFDRCWDTILVLDGSLRHDRKVGFGHNAELRKFIDALPVLAIRPVSKEVKSQVSLIEGEISRVEWDLQGLPFDELAFWPLGYDGVARWPFRGRMERIAVVSPFLSDKTLEKLTKGQPESVLVSRGECLDRISERALYSFDNTFQMNDTATPEAEDPEALPSIEPPLQGLHAKLYIADDGWNARTWTGSANATAAAFDGNVEFLVELTGRKSDVGVDAFLAKVKGSTSFSDLLNEYQRPDELIRNEELEALEKEIDDLRGPIASAGWAITLSQGEDAQQWNPVATTKHKLPHWDDHITVTCKPLSSTDSPHELVANTRVDQTLSSLALEKLTSFVVIEIEGVRKAGTLRVRFLVNAELVGAPSNRKDRLLRHMLQDRRSVLRFLFLLLSDFGEDPMAGGDGTGVSWNGHSRGAAESEALLEPLLRALDRSPGRLKAIDSLLRELSSTDEGRQLIPEGLPELFAAVWAAQDASA